MPRKNSRPAAKKIQARRKAIMEGKAKPVSKRYVDSGPARDYDRGLAGFAGALIGLGIANMFGNKS